MSLLEHYAQTLERLEQAGNRREFKPLQQLGRYIQLQSDQVPAPFMLNLSSNDYLGIAQDEQLKEAFFDLTPIAKRRMTSSSSRLLTGNFEEYEQFEHQLSDLFKGRAALLFNSGYHMNIGILPALSDARTLILADKLVHASLIDGIRLSAAQYVRYRHNDLDHLLQLIQRYHDREDIDRIIVVTESIFSMDGDETDLHELVRIKKLFDKVMLYVDEAHAIGVRGPQGLGCTEQYQVITEIDLIVGTFGKALASIGGYLICEPVIRSFLINTMRPLIFSTAQPPICIAWTQFVLNRSLELDAKRQHLIQLSTQLKHAVQNKGYQCPSTSQIVPIIIGDSTAAVSLSKQIQGAGFYVMPVRPPTVPQGTSRLRVCLNSQLQWHELEKFMERL